MTAFSIADNFNEYFEIRLATNVALKTNLTKFVIRFIAKSSIGSQKALMDRKSTPATPILSLFYWFTNEPAHLRGLCVMLSRPCGPESKSFRLS